MSDPFDVAQSCLVNACARRLRATHGADAHAFARDRLQGSIRADEPAEIAFWRQVVDVLERDGQPRPLWSRPERNGPGDPNHA